MKTLVARVALMCAIAWVAAPTAQTPQASSTSSAVPGLKLILKVQTDAAHRREAVAQAILVIQKRVNAFGVADPFVGEFGTTGDEIVVQLPGINGDAARRVEELIKRPGSLELKLVEAGPERDEKTALAKFHGQVPPEMEVVQGKVAEFFLVRKAAIVTGRDLRTARTALDSYNQPAIQFTLNPEGSAKFAAATTANVGRHIAIVLDKRVQSAPMISDPITAGDVQITGQFTKEEANELALVLKTGALPAPITTVEKSEIAAQAGVQTSPVPAGDAAFVGRWEIQLHPPPGGMPGLPSADLPLAIVDITRSNGVLAVVVVDSMGAPLMTTKIGDVSTKDTQIAMSFDLTIFGEATRMKVEGKRVSDHLEGSATVDNDPQTATWIGKPTTSAKVSAPKPPGQSADQTAFNDAMRKSSTPERRDALKKFIEDFPSSRLKEQAEYRLSQTGATPQEREAAQLQFAKDHPRSSYTFDIYRSLFESTLAAKPVDEQKLTRAIDGFIAASPSTPAAMNTIADRLMTSEVALEKALEVIKQALALAGENEFPANRAIYTTTYGQVLFKLKRYDEAETQLKRANEIAGGAGEAEAQWFLGKLAEVRGDEVAALDLYGKAMSIDGRATIRSSLETLWIKRHGSRAGLEEKLDEIYRAKPKPFDAGHYARPADSSNAHVVLAELFTGAECGPCVASDLAFDGLLERYGTDSVAVLEYHLHIPGPDPMTNADTVARAAFYNVNSTPNVMIDGQSAGVGGGSASASGLLFKSYTQRIESLIDKPAQAKLTDFRARVNGSIVQLTGAAALAGSTTSAHLHIAVVDDTVRYTGSNGIRFHSLVVRQLVGSPGGVAVAPTGSTNVSESIDVTKIVEAQEAYLTKYEQGESSRGRQFKFADHVDHIDAAHVRLVVFVQDDATKQILQAITITPAR